MAIGGAVERIELKTKKAETLVSLLREQISKMKTVVDQVDYAREAETLQKENQVLRAEIEQWKARLVQAEVAKGIPQLHASFSTSANTPPSPPPAATQVETPAAPVKEEPVVKAEPEQNANKKAEKPKKEKAPKGQNKQPQGQAEEQEVHVGRLDMRVGLIISAKKHPDADALYVEEVDVGEEKPRTVISGLVKFIPLEEMQNRRAILMCNLKPSKMRGIMSQAMVMCASTPDKVEILSPPENSKPGDPVEVEGFTRNPDAQLNPKKKIFEACAPDLKVNSEGIATYKGIPWSVNGEQCKSQTLKDVQVK